MRNQIVWTDAVPEHQGKKQVVWDLCYKPDGSILVVAVGQRLVTYGADDGVMRSQKIAHQGDVYTVSACRDGIYVASGGADKAVSVWTYELNQKYTYSHAESVQAVAFNPVSHNVLASCSAVDFAIWTMSSASLRKIKVPSKILCAAWTSDGQYLALGMLNGNISLRDGTTGGGGAEKLVISRQAPIWDLCWVPSSNSSATVPPNNKPGGAAAVNDPSLADPYDTLAVACWDGTLSYYQLTGQPIGKDRVLGFDPTSVKLLSSGDYMVVSGSDKKAILMTKDGIKLNTVGESKDWIWRACPRPRSTQIATASNDGSIIVNSVSFSTVHGLYQDRYAFRENMTDVVVQHLVTEQRVRIKCRDYVKKIAVYRDRLAVQLPDRILIYELTPEPETGSGSSGLGSSSPLPAPLLTSSSSTTTTTTSGGISTPVPLAPNASTNMMYRVKDKIFAQLDCNLLVVTSAHVILCLEKKLQLYDFKGRKEREWVLEAVIRYIKVVGGPAGGEGLLVGLKNGTVLRIYVDNPFPMSLIKHRASIRCLDLSMSRRKLAVVDDGNNCVVYDLLTGDQILSEPGANSVAWNTQMEDMLCFSGNGMLSIKTGSFPLHQQKLVGFVVGFSGSKIFCLQSVSMQTIDVPQSASLYRYIEEKDWGMAYRVACLGVTDSDWRTLGDAALRVLELGVARAAFVRLRDMRYIELINHIETSRKALAARRGGGGSGISTSVSSSFLTSSATTSSNNTFGSSGGGLVMGGAGSSGPSSQLSTIAAAGGGTTSGTPGTMNDEDAQYQAEVMAYIGKYQDAAKLHVKAGTIDKAVEMFTDMRLWAEARKFAEESGRVDVSSLMLKQAAWCEDNGDIGAAATIYAGLGMASRAVNLLGERGLYVQLLELVRTLPSVQLNSSSGSSNGVAESSSIEANGTETGSSSSGSDGSDGSSSSSGSGGVGKNVKEALIAAGEHFRRADLIKYAKEVYVKLNDQRALLQLHIDAQEWDDALNLARRVDNSSNTHSSSSKSGLSITTPNNSNNSNKATSTKSNSVSLVSYVHLSKAEWLSTEDQFEAAQDEYELAGQPELASRILEQLAVNAVEEERFEDASAHYVRLAKDTVAALDVYMNTCIANGVSLEETGGGDEGGGERRKKLIAAAARHRHYQHIADMYRAYHIVHSFLAAPFTSSTPETIFQAARFILNAGLGTLRSCTTPTHNSNNTIIVNSSSPGARVPYCISITRTLLALARQAASLHAYRTLRFAVDGLASMLIPLQWRDTVDLLALGVQTKPTTDREDLVPVCFRCGASGAVVTANAVSLTVPPQSRPRLPVYHRVGRGNRANNNKDGGNNSFSHSLFSANTQKTITNENSTSAAEEEEGQFSEATREPVDSSFNAEGWLCGDSCAGCGQAILRSALTFEPLPLIEFVPPQGMSAVEAIRMLQAHWDPSSNTNTNNSSNNSNKAASGNTTTSTIQTMTFDTNDSNSNNTNTGGEQAFAALVRAIDSSSSSSSSGGNSNNVGGKPLAIPASVLRGLEPTTVFVARSLATIPSDASAPASVAGPSEERQLLVPRFFKNMIPEIVISMCPACCRFFHAEDFEFEVLKRGCCPACMTSSAKLAPPTKW